MTQEEKKAAIKRLLDTNKQASINQLIKERDLLIKYAAHGTFGCAVDHINDLIKQIEEE